MRGEYAKTTARGLGLLQRFVSAFYSLKIHNTLCYHFLFSLLLSVYPFFDLLGVSSELI